MVDNRALDEVGDLFATRLAELLSGARRRRHLSLRAIAKGSGGSLDRSQLKALESGKHPLDSEVVERVVELYGVDLGEILPSRTPIVVNDGAVSTRGARAEFTMGNESELLAAYLRLVRMLRGESHSMVVDLRKDDIDVLAMHLDIPGRAVVDRLGALMGATRDQRAAMAARFAEDAMVIGIAHGAG